jgi:MFS family permease
MQFLIYVLISGFSLGVNFNGCMSALNTYYDKYKTLAASIASVGHNLGLVIFADLISSSDEHFGWKGVLLFLSGIMLNSCACAMVMFPPWNGTNVKY